MKEAVSRVANDRFSYSYFSFTRRSNQAKVTYQASLGKPIVPIVFFQETTIHFIIYGERHLINMEEGIFSLGYNNGWHHRLDHMHINKGKVYGRQGKAPTGIIFNIVDYWWCSGENTRLPLALPRFKPGRRSQIWFEFDVVLSFAPRGFLGVLISKFQLD